MIECKVCAYVVGRLKEPSTWRGLVWIAGYCGAKFTNVDTENIILNGMLLAGILGTLWPDHKHGQRGARGPRGVKGK